MTDDQDGGGKFTPEGDAAVERFMPLLKKLDEEIASYTQQHAGEFFAVQDSLIVLELLAEKLIGKNFGKKASMRASQFSNQLKQGAKAWADREAYQRRGRNIQ